MDYVAFKALLCVAGVIGLHFYFRRLVKSVLKDNRYFASEILEEFERRERQRGEWADSFRRVEADKRKRKDQ
jgi:hypothetical protein